MKATGIVRRIDELGRLVIPKEIRKTFKIREGDSIEFFVEGNRILLEKYSLINGIAHDIEKICQTLQESLDNTILYVFEEMVITGYGKKVQEYFEYPVSRNIKQYLNDRVNTKFKEIPININSKVNMSGYISPIIVNSDLFGAFVLLEDERVITERDIELVQVISKIVTKQQEVQNSSIECEVLQYAFR